MRKRPAGQPARVLAIADRAQERLHSRYFKLKEGYKKPHNVAVVAIALPVPDAAPHEAPEAAAHVQLTFVSDAGNVSVTVAEGTSPGPRFVAVIV